uniref:Small integral membrane protein 47 n=1 Tax=Ornithorhynchus anatinus TaxID=9258 RepID=A0A6I8PBH6_ORNAN
KNWQESVCMAMAALTVVASIYFFHLAQN